MNGEKRVQLPTGEVVAFPDTMGDDAIASAIQRNFPPQQQQTNEQGLTPDVEALRQRNMAEAMRQGGSPLAKTVQAGRDVRGALQNAQMPEIVKQLLGIATSPVQSSLEAALQAQQGNPLGGGLGIINAAAEKAFEPVSEINAAVRQVPYAGPAVSYAAGLVPRLLGAGGEAVGSLLAPLVPQSMTGKTPEQQQYTGEQAKQFASTVGQVAGGELLGLGLRKAGVPFSTQEAQQRGLAKSEAEFNEAIKPKKGQIDRMDILKRAEPYIKQVENETPIKDRPTSGPDAISATRRAYEMTADAAQKINEKAEDQVDRHGAVPIPIDDVGAQIKAQITPNMERFAPEQAAKIDALSQRYAGQLPLRQAYDEVQRLNQETRAYERATPDQQLTMRQTDPTLNAQIIARDALRNTMFDNLEALGEKDVPELRKDYGALAQLRNDIGGKIVQAESQIGKSNVFGRAWSPFSAALAGEVALKLAHGSAGPLAVGGAVGLLRKVFLERQKIDPTLERSITRMGKSKAIPEPRDVTPQAGPESVYPNFKSPEMKGVVQNPFHRDFVERAGGKYLGTNPRGSIFFDDNAGSTGEIPAGASLRTAKKIIAGSNKKFKP